MYPLVSKPPWVAVGSDQTCASRWPAGTFAPAHGPPLLGGRG
jgi:hypothetical protein